MKARDRFFEVLYNYGVMSIKQITTVMNYSTNTVYGLIYDNSDDLQRMDMPEIGRNSKVYYLSGQAAKRIAQAKKQEDLFKEKDYKTPPGHALHTLMVNQFVCELIQATKETEGTGITEWLGRPSMQQRIVEEKKSHVLPGYVQFVEEMKRFVIYLDSFTGNETTASIKECLETNMQRIVQERPEQPEKALYLILVLDKATERKVLQMVTMIKQANPNMKTPYVAVCHFETLAAQGVFSSSWQTVGGHSVSLLEMPHLEINQTIPETMFIGKKKRTVKQIMGFSGFSSPQPASSAGVFEGIKWAAPTGKEIN